MSSFDEPLKDYASYFREHHARNVSAYFESLVRESGIDEPANIQTVSELRQLESGISSVGSARAKWRIGRVVLLLLAACCAIFAFQGSSANHLLIVPAISLIGAVLKWINPRIFELNGRVQELEAAKKVKSDEAWLQMEPLNRLHAWEVPARLFHESYPDIRMDKYLSANRLADLMETYGLPTDFNDWRSILATQSGEIKGNPFVVCNYLQHWIGSRTYNGSLVIHWTEQTRNSNGEWVTVQRTQTLTASVVKPHPEFQESTILIYGHEAAPNLNFSRKPSRLSGLEDNRLNNWRKDRAVGKVAKQARKQLDKGTGQLTVMSNREFEALFNAVDRDDELEFRLLFTPLSQQEMVKLLNDDKVGYGDDFHFTKMGSINLIEPGHLNGIAIDGDPRRFYSLELAEARQIFNNYNNEYFRAIYFALAPLLTIPLYREARSFPAYEVHSHDHVSTFWDHEALANLFGEGQFAHPDSVTRSLLKTTAHRTGDSSTEVTVTAHGYKGIPRVDYVTVRGGDGDLHQVPVPWTEYIAVQRDSRMLVGVLRNQADDADESTHEELRSVWGSMVEHHGIASQNSFVRGTLAAALLG